MIPGPALLWFWYVVGTIMGVGLPVIVLSVSIAFVAKAFRLEQHKEHKRMGRSGGCPVHSFAPACEECRKTTVLYQGRH